MKKMKQFYGLLILTLFINSCSSVKTAVTFKNYIETDVTVNIESYNKKGSLKVNESVSVGKANKDKTTKEITSTDKIYATKGFRGGNLKMKFHPTNSNTTFTLDPIIVPNSKNDLIRVQALTGLIMYDVNDNKKRLLQLGTDLKFDSATVLSRLVDIKSLLGCLIFAKKENDKLRIIDNFQLDKIEIPYDKMSILQESTITEKSVMNSIKVAVPVYGSIETNMSSTDLCLVKWDISYFPFESAVSLSSLIVALEAPKREALIKVLKLLPANLDIYILRSFDVIDNGVFSTTNGTKINTDGNAAIASVFTASAAYAFKSEDSKFYSLPNKVYNIKYEKWQTVSELLAKLELKQNLPKDGLDIDNIMIPKFIIQ